MNFLKTPNLPEKPVKTVVLDGRASDGLVRTLAGLGIAIIKTRPHPGVYDAVSFHPDIVLHHVGDDVIVYAPGTDPGCIRELEQLGFAMKAGAAVPGPSYPRNIAYNAARVGQYVFHNLKYTDSVLRKELEKAGAELVHVNQGYSKCSVSVVDANSLITSDAGIARAAGKKGLDALLIGPDEGILLPGLSYGFIGGASGLVSSGAWLLSGKLSTLKSAEKINAFLSSKNVKTLSALPDQVVDYGSILPLLTI